MTSIDLSTFSIQVTPDIKIEPVKLDHIDGMTKTFNNKNVSKMFHGCLPFPWIREDSIEHINLSKPFYQADGKNTLVIFAILTTEGYEGEFYFKHYSASEMYAHDHFRLGYCLAEPIWNKGLATLCCNRVLKFLFENLPVKEISSYAHLRDTLR